MEKAPEQKAAAGTCDDENARRIREFLEGLLQHMNSPAQVNVVLEEKGRYQVTLEGEKLGQLIGRRGETLDAIQQLTNYAVNSGADKRIRVHVEPRTIGPSGSRVWSLWPGRWPARSPSIAAA